MFRVWRLECRFTGNGPYKSGYMPTLGTSFFSTMRPLPADDGVNWTLGHKFGFASFEQAQDWFSDAVDHWAKIEVPEDDLRLLLLEVLPGHVSTGNRDSKQVAFVHAQAKVIGNWPYTALEGPEPQIERTEDH